MSYPCRMTDPFLPIYDFDALEAEPDPIPVVLDYFTRKMDEALYDALANLTPAPKTVAELLQQGRGMRFDPVKYGVIVVSTPVIPWSI